MSVKLFELVAMISSLSIASNHVLGRGNGLETRPVIEPSERGDVIQNLSAFAGTPHPLGQGGDQLNKHLI
jgi:hypothetical protein